jgi:DNA-binding response OmpR family regulator
MAKILVVDDTKDLLDLLTVMFRIRGHEVAISSNAADATEKIESFYPDLVMLDIILGDSRGNDLCKKIKKDHPSLPIILMSASPPLLRNYKVYKADDSIEKPFDIPLMNKKIDALLSRAKEAVE